MQNNPLISIIMPAYNCDKYLAQSIDSIISQTYKNWELIVIDDNSTDESKNIALSYNQKDHRIIVVENKYNKGIHGALNSGLDICRGDFIARADGDDINLSERLNTQLEFLHNNQDIDIVGTGYQLFGNNKNKKVFHPSSSAFLAYKFISNTYFCHPSVMFRKNVLSTIPHYPEVACEDFAFFSKIIQKHKGANINKIMLLYRQHESNYSNTANKNIEESVKDTFLENYKFYTGEEKDSEIFYDFQHNKKIDCKNLFLINKINKKIAKSIKDKYRLSYLEYLNLIISQTRDLIKVSIFTKLKILYKFLKRN